jgi:hypothetical protein
MEVRSTAARATQRGWCYCTCSTDCQDTVRQSRIWVGMRKGGGDRRAERAYARSWRRSALPVHFRALSAQEHDHFSGLSGGLGQIAGECMRRDSAPFLRLAWAREWDVWQLSTPVGCSRRGRPDTVSTRSSPSRRSPPSRYPGICHAAIRLRYFLWYAEAGMWHK